MKGKRVITKAIVKGSYGKPSFLPYLIDTNWELHSGNGNNNYRSIYRREQEVTGICLGKSHLQEGHFYPGGYGGGGVLATYEPSEFSSTKRHAVYVIEPDGTEKDRYYKPVRALVKDVREEK